MKPFQILCIEDDWFFQDVIQGVIDDSTIKDDVELIFATSLDEMRMRIKENSQIFMAIIDGNFPETSGGNPKFSLPMAIDIARDANIAHILAYSSEKERINNLSQGNAPDEFFDKNGGALKLIDAIVDRINGIA